MKTRRSINASSITEDKEPSISLILVKQITANAGNQVPKAFLSLVFTEVNYSQILEQLILAGR